MIDPHLERRATLVLGDFLVSLGAFYLAGWLRFGNEFARTWEQILGLPSLVWFGPALSVLVVLIFWVAGLYRSEFHWSAKTEVADLFKATVAVVAVVLSLLFLFKLQDVSRRLLIVFFGMVAVGALGLRLAARWRSRHRLEVRGERRRVLIVGEGAMAVEVVERIRRHPHLGLLVIGYLGRPASIVEGLRLLGGVPELSEVLAREVVDEVVVCLPQQDWNLLDAITSACQEQGKAVRVPIENMHHTLALSRFDDLDGLPMLSLIGSVETHPTLVAKRLVDMLGASLLLILLAPVLVTAAGLLVMSQRRPILFRQFRAGLHGRPFAAYKFRTMVPDAAAQRSGMVERNERVGPAFKVRDDPRITPLGRWLRKTSFDELPQLFNVIKGDMSLVGPRPQPVEEVASYDFWHRRRLSMKPGITGLWQITARNDPGFDRWMELDLEYIDSWSLWMDLRILVQTPLALVRSPGT
jgi:exopolysaccharide biosynthesis polyprenyl glycosylphosphotransferase